MEKLSELTLKEHLLEFKKKVFWCIAIFIFTTSICYIYIEHIYIFLTKPLLEIYSPIEGRRFIYTSLTEAFFTYLKISCYCGLVLSFPFIVFQLYSFIAPGLYKSEKILFVFIILLIPILFFFGVVIVYQYVIPMTWKFFLSFELQKTTERLPIMLEAKISDYLDLILEMIIGFGIAFQLPVIVVLITKIHYTNSKFLIKVRKYAIVVIFIIAAILTPPDIISQILLAIPMLLLYEISIILCKIFEKLGTKKDARP